MATIVAAAGGGNWQTNGTWVGGVKPTAADSVQLSASSGPVTIDTGAVCRGLDCTGYTNTLTHTAGVTLTIGDGTAALSNIALKFVSTMTYTKGNITSSAINFISTSATQQTVEFGTKIPGNLSFGGANSGSWIFNDGFTNTSMTLSFSVGTLNLNGQTISMSNMSYFIGVLTPTLTLGAANITLSASTTGNSAWGISDLGNLSAASSTITCTGANAGFYGGGKTYGTVILNSTTGSLTTGLVMAGGTNTFSTLTITGSAAKTSKVSLMSNQTITGTLTINGNSATNRILVQSVIETPDGSSTTDVKGTPRTLTAATVAVTNADFLDITGAGAGSWNLAAITGLSGDCGGNSGITFTTTAPQTHTTSAGGNWSDVTKWTSRVPLPQDNVTIDVNTTGTLTADMPRLGKTITFTGFAGTLDCSSVANSVFGSLTLASGMTLSGTQILTLAGRTSLTLTSAGKQFTQALVFVPPSGTYTLQDALSTAGSLAFNAGTFATNNFNITALSVKTLGSVINPSEPTVVTLQLGTGTWSLTSTTAAITIWNVNGNTTVTSSTSTIVISQSTSNSRTFAGNGSTYNTLQYDVAGSTGELIITGANTFANLTIGSGRTLTLPSSTTTTITGTLSLTGSTLQSSSSGTAATISKAAGTGTVSAFSMSIQDSTATGGALFHAFDSTSVSGNTGWIFSTTSADLILVPYADVAINSWTNQAAGTTNLYQSIDETIVDDTDYIQSPAGPTVTQYYEGSLENHADPLSSTGHIVHYRYQKNVAGGNVDLTVALRRITSEMLTVNQQGLETDTTGWAAVSNCTIARSTADFHSGIACLELTGTAASTCSAQTPIGLSGFAVFPGDTITVSCWVKAASTTRNMFLRLTYYNAAGTLGSSDIGASATDSASVWTFLFYFATVPTNSFFADVDIFNSTAIGEVHRFDDFSVQRNGVPIASWTHTNISNAWTTQNQTLSGGQADSITDYSDLRLRFLPATTTSDIVPTYVADRATANSNSTVTTVDLVLTGLTVNNYLIIRSAADNSGGSGAARTFTPSNLSGTAMGTHQEIQSNEDPGAASAGTTCNVSVIKIAATSGTIRLTYSGAVVQACVAEEWSGIDTTTPISSGPTVGSATASSNLASLAQGTTAASNVVYAVEAIEGPPTDTYTQDTDTFNGSWVGITKLGTTNATADTNQTTYGAYKLLTATGTQTYNPTINTTPDSAGIIFELAAATPTIKTQVSWANLELPSVTSSPVGASASVGSYFTGAGPFSFGAGDM